MQAGPQGSPGRALSTMKYKKFITIMQAALGVAPLNKRELIPAPRKLWKPHR